MKKSLYFITLKVFIFNEIILFCYLSLFFNINYTSHTYVFIEISQFGPSILILNTL